MEDGIKQINGHNFQQLWDSCFQFCGGLGKDGETSGVVLTLVSATRLGAKLLGVGSMDIDLKIRKSKNLPLFSKKATAHLASRISVQSLGLRFGPEQDMQPRFVSLINFIADHKRDPEETKKYSFTWGDEMIEGVTVTEYLGSVAFCFVYKCEEENDIPVILKMGKNWNDKECLEQELNALQQLKHEGIPKLFKDKLVSVTVKERCKRNHVPSLLLNVPIGVPVQERMQNSNVNIQNLFTAVENILDYAHSQEWFHLDFQPSNIIVVDNNGNEDPR